MEVCLPNLEQIRSQSLGRRAIFDTLHTCFAYFAMLCSSAKTSGSRFHQEWGEPSNDFKPLPDLCPTPARQILLQGPEGRPIMFVGFSLSCFLCHSVCLFVSFFRLELWTMLNTLIPPTRYVGHVLAFCTLRIAQHSVVTHYTCCVHTMLWRGQCQGAWISRGGVNLSKPHCRMRPWATLVWPKKGVMLF